MIETERKYLGANRHVLRSRLTRMGAVSGGCHFESNTVFDTPEHRLHAAGKLLRLRVQQWRQKSCTIVTFKQKLPPGQEPGQVKAREELETSIADFTIAAAIFSGCGFAPVARYEKVREQWQFQPESEFFGLTVDLDILPFGFVAEIEGQPQLMDTLAALLGLDKTKISLKTYHELNQQWRETEGLPFSADLLFEHPKRARLRKALGLV